MSDHPNNPDRMDELQRMLALKRHETPPPRFFKGFSHQVINRLDAPEQPGPQTWWQRLGLEVDSKPVLVCVCGVVVCGLLLLGLIGSLRIIPPKPAPRALSDTTHFVVAPPVSAQPPLAAEETDRPGTGELPRLGEPVVTPTPSPFNQLKLQPASAKVGVTTGTAPATTGQKPAR